MRGRTFTAALAVAITVLAASSAEASGGSTASPPRVTLISDSVGAAIAFDPGAIATLSEGVDLFLEPGQGRVLGGTNQRGEIAPPTALELIATLGHKLGRTVIVEIGSNDVSSDYAANVQRALDELRQAGVSRVLWATLHDSPEHAGNAAMNAAIAAAAVSHPELTVVDWNAYAHGRPEWFAPDDVHLTGDGPRALARLLHQALVTDGVVPR